jgi:hypothetical protein
MIAVAWAMSSCGNNFSSGYLHNAAAYEPEISPTNYSAFAESQVQLANMVYHRDLPNSQ